MTRKALILSSMVFTSSLGCGVSPVAPPAVATPGQAAPPAADQKKVLASLIGTEWTLVDLCGVPPIAGSSPTLVFPEPGKIGGNGSVNSFGGEIVLARGRPVIKAASTLIGASPALMEQESKFHDALSKALSFSANGNSLRIRVEAQDKPLRFARTK